MILLCRPVGRNLGDRAFQPVDRIGRVIASPEIIHPDEQQDDVRIFHLFQGARDDGIQTLLVAGGGVLIVRNQPARMTFTVAVRQGVGGVAGLQPDKVQIITGVGHQLVKPVPVSAGNRYAHGDRIAQRASPGSGARPKVLPKWWRWLARCSLSPFAFTALTT